MTVDSRLMAPSPADALVAKLDEPRVAEALDQLLEHADLLALLVLGLDGLVRRSEEISGVLAGAVGDLRGAAGGSDPLGSVDLPKLVGSLRVLSSALPEATPALESLLRSDLTDSRAIELISVAARSLVAGAEQARTDPVNVSGAFSLLRALKDEDVARGIGFLIQVARAFGKEINEEPKNT